MDRPVPVPHPALTEPALQPAHSRAHSAQDTHSSPFSSDPSTHTLAQSKLRNLSKLASCLYQQTGLTTSCPFFLLNKSKRWVIGTWITL